MSCSLGVGCDEYGVCYAAAHDQPEQCGDNTMSHLADSTFIKAFGTSEPYDPEGNAAMSVPIPNDDYAVVHACIPPHWSVQRFIAAINGHVRSVIGSELFYDSQLGADLANMEQGATPDNFTDLEVTFRKA